jgi:transcription elongation GreA/GreB family factor
MSRAFVKEDAGGDEPLPERHVSEHPNRVTPAGLALLKEMVARLRGEAADLSAVADDTAAADRRRHVERDLRYFEARLATAEVVDPRKQPRDAVAFGATVTTRDARGERHVYSIVGEDEADPESGKVSWVSPLGAVLTGAHVRETVCWRRPAGALDLTVERIEY